MLILGCGYIGTALAQVELAAGGRVGAVTRNTGRATELRAMGVQPVVVADLASDLWHREFNPSGETVVNCVSPASPGAAGYRHSFIEGTNSLTRWLEQSAAAGGQPAREVLFTSSTSVYPQTDGSWIDEGTQANSAAQGPAGLLLREAEEMVRALPAQLVRRTWVLRFAGLYGPDRHHLLDTLRAGETAFPGGGDHWLNLLHRDDAVSAIRVCLAAAAELPGGIFNVVDNEPVLKRDLVVWLAEQLGMDSTAIGFNSGKSARSSHRQNAGGATPHRRVSNLRLRQNLGWQPKYPTYREGYGKIKSQAGVT